MIINNEKEFNENNKGVTLVDFYADWCGPCKMLLPVVTEIENETKGVYNILKVNIDNCSDIAAKYQVQSIPTLIYFKDGVEKDRGQGFAPKEVILENLAKLK